MKILLLSGGYDSTALAWELRPALALTVDYGQLAAEGEIRASRAVARALGLQHEVLTVDCRALGSGVMAGVPPLQEAPSQEWWPFRNQFLVTLAAMRALQIGAKGIVIGTVSTDRFHDDGKPEFINSMNRVLAAQEGILRLEAPAIDVKTADLVRRSGVPRDVLGWSHSCHVAPWACGTCPGCRKALSVRVELGHEPV
jgi:7-cyano-7-deazaguanine synthase